MEELAWPVRVYLEDTDAQGVVYNASYFRFMERARTEWLRQRGIDHNEARERHGVLFVLTSIEARFQAPARLGDPRFDARTRRLGGELGAERVGPARVHVDRLAQRGLDRSHERAAFDASRER